MRKRRYLSFVRRTKGVIAKQVAPSYILINRTASASSFANKQWVYEGHIVLFNKYPTEFVPPPTLDPFNDIETLETRVTLNAGTTFAPDRFVVTGWTATTTIKNATSGTVLPPLIVEAYYWKTLRDTPNDFESGTGSDPYPGYPGGVWTAALEQLAPSVPTGGSTMQISDLGITPFQGPTFAKYFRIYKKTRTVIDWGKTATFEQRSSKDVYIDMKRITNVGSIAYKTEGIFFVIRGAPQDATTGATPVDAAFNTNINYTYRLIQNATSFGGETKS